MARTNTAAVCAIIDTDLEDPQLSAFITTANVMVTTYLGSAVPALAADLLAEIEAYLAAHLVTLRDRIVQREAADGISFDYQGKTGMGLESSHYGQTAMLLDPSGALQEASGSSKIQWLARAGSERTSDDYRALIPSMSSHGP